ncbi:DNA-binding domain-containing protein [Cognatishimia maritima]|uniref:Putative DNA-binding domain-containing protein n=1 Tax=Cognatishimia maritima TaxID=870908 RepID=A0A1M5U2A9_9RHOB|nr:DNA-binding domain-containing protein [Cognatishimia maritima]SHH57094.1 Putative DNA-binding domain-containing protein [Cognatishimia maritima]
MTVTQTEFRAAMLNVDIAVPAGLVDTHDRPAGSRFDVYRNNVAVSLTEALETGFPVIAKLLGEANFKAIAGVFLRQSPPEAPVMMHYGAAFPQFLREFQPLQHLGYLGDVAEIELALRRSYHAADSQGVPGDALAQIAPEALAGARLSLAPSLEVVRSHWPIYDIWAFNTYQGRPKPEARAQNVVVLRPEFDPEPHPLPTGGASFIKEIHRGRTLGEAADITSNLAEDLDLGAVLGLLLSKGAITNITAAEQNEEDQ